MSYNHHRHFIHKHTQPLPDLEFRYRKALPRGSNSFHLPPKRVPAAWRAEGGEPSQFDYPQQPFDQQDRYNCWTIPRTAETARDKEIHAKLDHILAMFDKWENEWDATDRRIGRSYAPPRPEPALDRGEHRSAGQPWRDPSPLPLADGPTPPRHPNARYWGRFHDPPHPRTIANNWDQGGWDDRIDHRQQQGFEEYPRQHQRLHNGRAKQPTYRSPQPEPDLDQPHVSREYSDSSYVPPMQPHFTNMDPSYIPPKQPSPALPAELPPSATPAAYRPSQPLPVTTPTLAADPHPQSVVPIPMKKEGKLLDEVPSPPAVFSALCNPDISVKEETLLEDGVARERKTVDGEKETAIVKETILPNGDESGLMKEAMNCLREVSYPSVMVYAITCAGGSEITREEADRENDDIITRITLIRLCAFDPGICVSFSKRNWEFLAMHMEAMDLQVEDEKLHIDNVLWNALNMLSDDDKELPHGGFMKCLLATKTFNIGLNMPAKPVVFTNVQDFDGDYYVGRRLPIWRVFDPGGDASPKLLLPTIVVAS